MSISTQISTYQGYVSLVEEMSALLTSAGLESANTHQTIMHIAQVVTNPTLPQVVETIQSAHGAGILPAVLLGLAQVAPSLFVPAQPASPLLAAPPTAETPAVAINP